MERIILMVISGIFLLWFAAPYFTKRILNAGNITGMLLSAAILFVHLFEKGWKQRLELWQSTDSGKVFLLGLQVVGWILILFAIYGSLRMLLALFRRPKGPCTVVVLGCRVYGNRPSRMLRERLDAALKYLNKHPDAPCIVTGGKGDDEDISEALCMKEYLCAHGIDAGRIYMEDASINTRQNIFNAKEIIQKRQLPESIAVVTNEFHIYRSLRIAKRAGLKAYGLPAITAIWLLATFWLRELLCIANDRLGVV